jgi:hypothetical protein
MAAGYCNPASESESTDILGRISRPAFLHLSRTLEPYKPVLSSDNRVVRLKLYAWVNREMNLYEQSSDPKERRVHLHNAFSGLTRHLNINPKKPTLIEDLLRDRFLALIAFPRFQEDVNLCADYFDDDFEPRLAA